MIAKSKQGKCILTQHTLPKRRLRTALFCYQCFFQQLGYPCLWLFSSLFLCFIPAINPVVAQITSDGTSNTSVIKNNNTFLIEQGIAVKGNLFHSFAEFSLPTGNQAFFNNTLDIQNIISRVTGKTISTIDGILQANGTTNLFLINPNGITFGPNAQLNIGGSFIGTTASSIRFADDSEFSATNPQAPPLLTINVPLGLQFGSNPGRIVNQSQAGLQVLPGQTLALLGGDVILRGGNLAASQGRIELASVASPGLVSLTPTTTSFALGYQNIQNFGNIELSGAAALRTSGLGGGTIRIAGGQVLLTEGARLVAETFGNFDGGGIDIQATHFKLQDRAFVSTSTFGAGAGGSLRIRANAVEITGTTPLETSRQLLGGTFNPLNLSNGLFSLSAGSGRAGDLRIDTDQFIMQNGANLLTTTFISGGGGNLSLNVSGLAELKQGSILLTGTTGSAKAGDLTINANQLRVLDGTALSTNPGATSTGRGGNLTVQAQSVELKGTPAGAVVPGGLFTTTLGASDAGDLTVTTNQLFVTDGTQISASSAGSGRGGNLNVSADQVELSGASPDGRFLGGLFTSSSLLTVSGQRGTAAAGDLSITTRQLSVRNGAQISAATGSAGTAGTLTINASDFVDVTGFATGIDPSVERVSFGIVGDGIVPSAIETNTSGAGKAGNLIINTGRLTVRDGAEIGVRGTSSGAAGDLEVRANSILVDQGAITATSLLGQGGNIDLRVQEDVVLRHQSQISTRAGTQDTGGGNGGNITLNTGVLAVLENSQINANAFGGSGGNIRITTRGIFAPNGSITASSTLGVNGGVEIRRLDIDPSQGLVVLPVSLAEPSQQVSTDCSADRGNSFAITGRGGLPEDPTQTLRGQTVWRDLRLLNGRRGDQQLGRSRPEQEMPLKPTKTNLPPPMMEAQGWVINADAQVELVAQAPQGTPHTSWSQPADCSNFNSNLEKRE